VGGVTPSERRIGGGLVLSDEVDEGEPALADLAKDAEAALVDPDVAAARGRVVERVEPRDGAAHLCLVPFLFCSSPPANSDAARSKSWLVRWVRKSAASTRTKTMPCLFGLFPASPPKAAVMIVGIYCFVDPEPFRLLHLLSHIIHTILRFFS
jgi:hypothetical protein